MYFLVDHEDTGKNVTFNYMQSSKRWTVILATLYFHLFFFSRYLLIYLPFFVIQRTETHWNDTKQIEQSLPHPLV